MYILDFHWRCLLQKSHDWVEKILNRMFKWTLMYNILNDSNLTGFNLISSWDILYICPLASSWYTSGELWMHSSFRVSDCPNFVPIDPLSFFMCLVWWIISCHCNISMTWPWLKFYGVLLSGFWPSIKAFLFQIPVLGWVLQYPALVS